MPMKVREVIRLLDEARMGEDAIDPNQAVVVTVVAGFFVGPWARSKGPAPAMPNLFDWEEGMEGPGPGTYGDISNEA